MNKQSVVTRQKGAVVLLTVVLLLVMVSLVTLYTGKIQSFEHRMVLNTQNHTMAHSVASLGLETAIAQVNIHKAWLEPEVTSILDDDSQYKASGMSEVLSSHRQLISLSVTGQSADGLAQVNMGEQILVYPLLFNTPIAPLTIQGGVADTGEFEVVFNPHGLGSDNPLSVWSSGLVAMLGASQHSCSYEAFIEDKCVSEAHSHSGLKLADIADESATFPTDLFGYIFNIRSEDWPYLEAQADLVIESCESLDINSWGMIWVTGDCAVGPSTQVGSESQPVILIVYNGNLILEADALVYGLVFSFKPSDSVATLSVNMFDQAAIQGALVANYPLDSITTRMRIIFNSDVLDRLQTRPEFKRIARVPGSWHDF